MWTEQEDDLAVTDAELTVWLCTVDSFNPHDLKEAKEEEHTTNEPPRDNVRHFCAHAHRHHHHHHKNKLPMAVYCAESP